MVYQNSQEILHILIVDDENCMREAIDRSLKNYTIHIHELELEVGFEISQVETGEKALELIEKQNIDLLILDHKLPGISGLDVISRIDIKKHDLLIIMITAYSSLEIAINATKLGAYDFLAKPFNPNELKASVYKTAKHLLLRRKADRLEHEKKQIRFQFISVLAHELKAPLAAVEQYLNILLGNRQEEHDNIENQMLNRSISRIRDMRKMIIDILDLTKVESGQRARELTLIDLNKVAKRSLEIQEIEIERRSIKVSLEVHGEATIKGDQWEIETIFNNLLSNAVKYNRDGGQIKISIIGSKDEINIIVSDTGVGISQKDSAKLFKEFTRIRTQETEHIQGSGLGLVTVKKILSHYDGEITLESKEGIGTTFSVLLKKHPDKEEQNGIPG